MFGSSNTFGSSTFGGFGANTNNNANSGGLFGNKATNAFGSPAASTFGATTGTGFGSTTSGGLFGAKPANTGTTLFGASNTGTSSFGNTSFGGAAK